MNKNISIETFKELFDTNFAFDDNNFQCRHLGRRDEDGVIRNKDFLNARINTASSLISVIDVVGAKKILEIGTWKGYTAIAVGKYFNDKGNNDAIVHTLDIKVGGYDGGNHADASNLNVQFGYWMPHHTIYDDWKYNDNLIYNKSFKNLTNEEIYDENLKFLNSIKPEGGYDLVFVDGDHSYEGAEFDCNYALVVLCDSGVIVFDDRQGHGSVNRFFNDITKDKWDFSEVNQKHYQTQNVMHNFGIVFK